MKTLLAIATALMAASVFSQDTSAAAGARAERKGRMMAPRGQAGFAARPFLSDPVIRAAMNPRIAEAIGLTDEQKEKLKALRGAVANKELQEKIKSGYERQAELLKAEKTDEAALMAVVDQIYDAQKEMAKEQMKNIIAAKSVLTPEQIAKAMQLMKEMRPGGNRKKGKGKGQPPKAE